MPKISVVLPVYNGAEYLDAAIQSVLNQSFTDFELIIIDDCSNDETPNIAYNYISNSNVKYFKNEENIKLPASLNKGFSLASGEYLTWTSCDNVYLPDAFKRMVTVLDADLAIGMVYADIQVIDEKNNELYYVSAGPAEDLIFRNVVGACFLYRAQILDLIGEYSVSLFLCEDYEYWVRIALVKKIVPLNEKLYLYRIHEKSLSRNYTREIIAKGIAVQKNYYKYFIDNRTKAARFYSFLRARDIYNPWRQLYIFYVLFYNPIIFLKEIWNILRGRWYSYAQN